MNRQQYAPHDHHGIPAPEPEPLDAEPDPDDLVEFEAIARRQHELDEDFALHCPRRGI